MTDAGRAGQGDSARRERAVSFAGAIALLSGARHRGHHAPALEALHRGAAEIVHILESGDAEESPAWVLSLPAPAQDPAVRVASRLGYCHIH